MATSGKGEGTRHVRTRHQAVLAFPAWGSKTRSDVYFSSRWDSTYQIYAKNIDRWWSTAPWEWVYIQEVPYDVGRQEFM